ncbi:hypothetical protein I4F81_010904 [Pyropia yezoensis]|uniref:Uncharacterized protein n=1 Tax=Pyropia yezoensis TaxID=2788 RepID=A0ACC3CEP8_PYRYE|nr:hypothetical protein I4F81_010904 [Neopyropia yezoensis]
MKKARAGASHRGKSGSKFQFDITLHDVSGLKAGNTYFVKWTRGAKVASTKTAIVEGASATRGTRWEGDKLSLLVTLFRPPDGSAGFDVKDAKLALVAVNPAKRGSEKTVAKVHFNLADYAGVPSATATTRLTLSERVGIRMTVACKFLKVSSGPGADASYAPSGMSGLSGVTGLGGGSSSEEGVDDDFADLAVDDVPEPAPLRSPARGSREGSLGAGGSGSAAPSEAGRGASSASLSVRRSSSKEVPRRQSSTASHGGSSGALSAVTASGKDADHLRATLAAAVAERTRLTDALAAAAGEEEEVASQRRRLVALRAKVTDANDSRAALQQRMEEIRRTSAEQATSVDEARQRLATAQAAAKAPSRSLAATSPAPPVPGDTAGAVRAERERADALAASLAAKEVKIGAHATHAGKMKDTYTQLTGMYDRTQAENARLKAKVEAAKGAAVGAASGLSEAERAAEEAARKAEVMEGKLGTARKDITALTAETAALREATLRAEAATLREASAKASKERQRALDASNAGKRAARKTEVAARERRAATTARKATLGQLGRRVEELQAAATLAAVRGVSDGRPSSGSGELSDVPLARLGSMNVEGVIADLVTTKLQLAETEDLRLAAQHKAKQQRRQERLIQERLAKHASRLEVKLGEARAELEAIQKERLKLELPSGVGAGGDAGTPAPGGGRATPAKATSGGGGTPARRNFFGFALGGGGTPSSTPVSRTSGGGGEENLSPPSPNSLSF